MITVHTELANLQLCQLGHGEDDEHNGVEFVEISTHIVMPDVFAIGT